MGFGFQTSFGDITGALGDLFGQQSGQEEIKTGTEVKAGTVTEGLDISDEGVSKIISDLLSSEQGLASIFSEENVAGIYDSSVAKQASGDLMANIAGEIAKLKAKKVTTTDESTETAEETAIDTSKEGLLEDSAQTHKDQERAKWEGAFKPKGRNVIQSLGLSGPF